MFFLICFCPFLSSICPVCGCSLEGSETRLCDRYTGQCKCHPGAYGKHCDGCKAGYWGFPNCRPCQCNGHAEECDQKTGACISCRSNTGGDNCERWNLKLGQILKMKNNYIDNKLSCTFFRCADGYYVNPNSGLCHPCPCPEGPNTGRHFAATCYQDSQRRQIICNCNQGYIGGVYVYLSFSVILKSIIYKKDTHSHIDWHDFENTFKSQLVPAKCQKIYQKLKYN